MLGGGVLWTRRGTRPGAGAGNEEEEKTGGRRGGSTATPSRGDLCTTSPGLSQTGGGERGEDAGLGRLVLVERGRRNTGVTTIVSRTAETEQEVEEEVGGGERREADGLEGGRSREGRSIRPGSSAHFRLGMDLTGGPVWSVTTPTGQRIGSTV